jgi:O-antigen/teichoic acid export membrane protein
MARRLLPSISFRPRAHWQAFRRLLSFGVLSSMSGLFSSTTYQFDRLFIGALLGTGAVTFYVVPVTLARVIAAVTGRLATVLFPLASELSSTGQPERLRDIYLRSSRFIVVINTALAVPLIGLAYPTLRFWMGPSFADAGAVVMVLIVAAYYLTALTVVPAYVVGGMGHPGITAVFSWITAILNLSLLFPLIRAYGIVGAAWSCLISVSHSPLDIIYVNRRVIKVSSWQLFRCSYAGPLAAGAVALAVARLIVAQHVHSLPVLAAAFAGLFAFYFALVLACGGLDRDDRRILRQAVSALPARLGRRPSATALP